MDDKLDRILTHPLLRDLPDSVMAGIRQLLVRRTVRAGAHIFSKGGNQRSFAHRVRRQICDPYSNALI